LANSTVRSLVWILGPLCFVVISNSRTDIRLLKTFYSSQPKLCQLKYHISFVAQSFKAENGKLILLKYFKFNFQFI